MRRASHSAEEIEELLRFNHPNRERHRRYVLINEISGHVWGDVVAADPISLPRYRREMRPAQAQKNIRTSAARHSMVVPAIMSI
jgi:hypothetical protein